MVHYIHTICKVWRCMSILHLVWRLRPLRTFQRDVAHIAIVFWPLCNSLKGESKTFFLLWEPISCKAARLYFYLQWPAYVQGLSHSHPFIANYPHSRMSHQNRKLEYAIGLRTTIDLWPTLLNFFFIRIFRPWLAFPPPLRYMKSKIVWRLGGR